MSFHLHAGAFHSLPRFEERDGRDVEHYFRSLCGLIDEQTRWAQENVRADIAGQINRHFVCSTIIDFPFTSGQLDWELIRREWFDPSIVQPTNFVNTYECASWGYCLRFHDRFFPDSPYVLLSILDANVYNLTFWRENPNWGGSGFGLCTLLLERRGDPMDGPPVTASCAQTFFSVPEFTTAVRGVAQRNAQYTLSMPFFPVNIREIFERMLPMERVLEDRHDHYGHCFGSDPWVNIIERGVAGTADHSPYLASSVALNGYYCMAPVTVDADSVYRMTAPEVES